MEFQNIDELLKTAAEGDTQALRQVGRVVIASLREDSILQRLKEPRVETNESITLDPLTNDEAAGQTVNIPGIPFITLYREVRGGSAYVVDDGNFGFRPPMTLSVNEIRAQIVKVYFRLFQSNVWRIPEVYVPLLYDRALEDFEASLVQAISDAIDTYFFTMVNASIDDQISKNTTDDPGRIRSIDAFTIAYRAVKSGDLTSGYARILSPDRPDSSITSTAIEIGMKLLTSLVRGLFKYSRLPREVYVMPQDMYDHIMAWSHEYLGPATAQVFFYGPGSVVANKAVLGNIPVILMSKHISYAYKGDYVPYEGSIEGLEIIRNVFAGRKVKDIELHANVADTNVSSIADEVNTGGHLEDSASNNFASSPETDNGTWFFLFNKTHALYHGVFDQFHITRDKHTPQTPEHDYWNTGGHTTLGPVISFHMAVWAAAALLNITGVARGAVRLPWIF